MHWAWKALVVYCALVATATLVVGPQLIDKVDSNAEKADADARIAQFEACQRSNRQLRFVINRNIVRPVHDVVKIAATPSGDPAFDIFVPFYKRTLSYIEPVPYAICRNAYPPDGSDPHPPYFRDARLPNPLQPNGARGSRSEVGTGTSPNGVAGNASAGGDAAQTGTPPVQQPSPPVSGPPGRPGAPGQPGSPGTPGEPGQPPPDMPGLLDPITDPVCGLTDALGLPVCL